MYSVWGDLFEEDVNTHFFIEFRVIHGNAVIVDTIEL